MNRVHASSASLAVGNSFVHSAFAPRSPSMGMPAAAPRSAIASPAQAVDLAEVEEAGADAVEIKVTWKGDVVHVAHVADGDTFTLGDAGCDFALPSETVGAAKFPLVSGRAGRLTLLVPRDASASLAGKGGPSRTIDELAAAGLAHASRDHVGAQVVVLEPGMTARVELAEAGVTFELAHVRAGKRLPVSLLANVSSDSHAYTGLSAFLHGAIVLSLAFFLPAMKANDAEDIDRDQIDAMKPYLASIAEREQEADPEPAVVETTGEQAGGTGAQAKGESGTMGTLNAAANSARYGIKGRADNDDPHIARERAKLEAETFGMVGILMGSPENAPVAAWGQLDASGKDPKSALGNMWGSSIDDAFGAAGLGISGIGEGGGGRYEGIGLGDHGQLGHGLGDGAGPGIGNGPGGWGRGHDRLPPTHVAQGIRLREGITNYSGGQLPAEVIQRIVRQNFGRFRVCYEDGLRTNPAMTGRVAVKFVIARDGSVSLASDGGSDLPDQKVIACVVRGFNNLTFPEPKGGQVKVTYPIVFTPGE